MRLRLIVGLFIGSAIVTAGSSVLSNDKSADEMSLRAMEQEYRQLQLKMTVEKQRLLREDEEVAAINSQILALYDELEKKISANPSARDLQKQMDILSEKILRMKN